MVNLCYAKEIPETGLEHFWVTKVLSGVQRWIRMPPKQPQPLRISQRKCVAQIQPTWAPHRGFWHSATFEPQVLPEFLCRTRGGWCPQESVTDLCTLSSGFSWWGDTQGTYPFHLDCDPTGTPPRVASPLLTLLHLRSLKTPSVLSPPQFLLNSLQVI